jgi:hypothetical protein
MAHPVPVDQVEPRVSLTQMLKWLHAAQGGVTLGPEQGREFCCLGKVTLSISTVGADFDSTRPASDIELYG